MRAPALIAIDSPGLATLEGEGGGVLNMILENNSLLTLIKTKQWMLKIIAKFKLKQSQVW